MNGHGAHDSLGFKNYVTQNAHKTHLLYPEGGGTKCALSSDFFDHIDLLNLTQNPQ